MGTNTGWGRYRGVAVAIACVCAVAIVALAIAHLSDPAPVPTPAARANDSASPVLSARSALPTTPPAADRETRATDTGCVIVHYAEGERPSKTGSPLGSGAFLMPVPAGKTVDQYLEELSEEPGVLAAEPDYLLKTAASYTATPNDPDYNNPAAYAFGAGSSQVNVAYAKSWGLHGIYSPRFDQIWPALEWADAGPEQVHVAVIDTGYYFDHPDARFSNIRAAIDECATYDPVTARLTTDAVVAPVSLDVIQNPDPVGVASHGTMTASEIGAATNNLEGSAGAAYDTVVDIYKVQGVTTAEGQGYDENESVIPESAIINAINDAVAASQRGGYRLVINISLVLIEPDADKLVLLKQAVAAARSKGVVVVCAAGNEHSSPVLYPAACPGAVAVGGSTVTTRGVARDWYSSYGSAIDLMGPGTYLWGPTKPGHVKNGGDEPGYTWWTGTSFSTPLVSSAAALLLRVEPTLTATEVVTYLERGATDLDTAGWDNRTGWGQLNAYKSYYLLTAPRTTANVQPRYTLEATITFTVSDRDSGSDVTTYYRIDGGNGVLSGPVATFSALGTHVIEYWSVDGNGVKEEPSHIESFEIVLPDITPPVTSSDVASTYMGRATIRLTGTDDDPLSWGFGQSFYTLDGGNVRSGDRVVTGAVGPHVLHFWSKDAFGNVELPHEATFTVEQLPTDVTLSRSAARISRGAKVRLSGSLTPALTGDYVRLQVRPPGTKTWKYIGGGDWRIYRRTVTSVNSSDRGTWSPVSIALRSRGTYSFRAVYGGDTVKFARHGDVSSVVSVTVR